jgi:hypothetical protein
LPRRVVIGSNLEAQGFAKRSHTFFRDRHVGLAR